jgi:tetratricopeptide (TPR) repeat protein
MNPAYSTSRYSKPSLETDGFGRPSKRIRTAACFATALVESSNASGIDAIRRGDYTRAEEDFTHAIRRISPTSVCLCNTGKRVATCDKMCMTAILSDDDNENSTGPAAQVIVCPSKYDEGMDKFQEPEPICGPFEADFFSSRLHHNLGLAKIARGKCNEALACFRTSFQKSLRYVGEETMFRFRLLHKIGFCNFCLGNGKEATQSFHQALELAAAASLDKVFVAACLNCLAVVDFHHHPEKAERSIQLLKQSLIIYREHQGGVTKEVATILNNVGRIHYLRSEYKDALVAYADALAIRVHVLGINSIDVAATAYNSGQCYQQLGQHDNALQLYKRFLDLTNENGGYFRRDAAIVYRSIGEIYQLKGELSHALSAFKNALLSEKQSLGKFHQDVAFTLNKLGNLCYEMQDLQLALTYYEEGLEIETAILDPLHPHIIITLTNIAHIEVSIEFVYFVAESCPRPSLTQLIDATLETMS